MTRPVAICRLIQNLPKAMYKDTELDKERKTNSWNLYYHQLDRVRATAAHDHSRKALLQQLGG